MGFFNKMFGGSKAGTVGSQEVPVMEIEDISKSRTFREIEPIHVKTMELRSLIDVDEVANELRNGNIIILEISPLMNQDPDQLKRAIDQIKGICQAIGGDIGRLTESKVIATPKFVEIQKKT